MSTGAGLTFNDNARISSRRVQKRSGGRTGAKLGGGGLVVVLGLWLFSSLTGINLMPFTDVATQGYNQVTGGGGGSVVALEGCDTGADANTNDECRMTGATDALDQYWSTQVSNYRPSNLVLFSGATSSQCGTASSQTGPFYCPPEEMIYIDTAFFETLSTEYGASTGSLAQIYVLAHEWGHHVSNLIGTIDVDRSSGADSGSVRLELQADCFAGAWMQDASDATDETGVPLLKPITEAELRDAMSAAAAVGDDHIMESAGVDVEPERFTHGTSEQRQRWLTIGYEEGPTGCDTFSVPASSL